MQNNNTQTATQQATTQQAQWRTDEEMCSIVGDEWLDIDLGANNKNTFEKKKALLLDIANEWLAAEGAGIQVLDVVDNDDDLSWLVI